MSTLAGAAGGAAEGRRAGVNRLLSALPLLLVFVWLCFLYAWQAWSHPAPWLFTDELELTQLSRSIAETGHAARRGQPHWFDTLYAYVLAPVWWISDMGTAYAAAKYVGVVLMSSALFPAYALARLVVSARHALFVATATAVIPALAYSSLLIEEPLAYTWSTLSLFLIAKALVTRSRRWIGAALAASLVAPLVRTQLGVLLVVFLLAALLLAWASPRGRAWRAGWSRWDWAGAALLAAGAGILTSELIGDVSESWLVATGYYKGRMLENGLWAAGAFTIGLGVLPVVAGLAALASPRRASRTPAERVFVAVGLASVAAFGWYTAVKAAYISTVFSTLVVERNLIYLAPVLFLGTALFFERRRVRLGALAVSAALALYLILTTPYQMQFKLYSDAPGLAILQAANRQLAWTPGTAKAVLLAMLAFSVLVLLSPLVLRGRERVQQATLAAVAVLVLGWNVTGEIAAASASNEISEQLVSNMPHPPDWVDRRTGGQPTMYLGQGITDPNGVWLLEFWNRSIRYVWSLDSTAPGPGPVTNPNIATPTGTFQQQWGNLRYVVADPGIDVLGRVVSKRIHFAGGRPLVWRLYRIEYPLRIRHGSAGIYPDGWIGSDASYSQYSTRSGKPGYALVTVSRTGWAGPDVPGRVRITVGKLVIDSDFQPRIGTVTAVRSWTVRRQLARRFVIPSPAPPFRVEVRISPTFVPMSLDPRISDRRELGAVVRFGFAERRPRA